jgi:hypothetical protein
MGRLIILFICVASFICRPKSSRLDDLHIDTTTEKKAFSVSLSIPIGALSHQRLRMTKKLGGTWISKTHPESVISFDADSIYYPKERKYRQKYTSFKYFLSGDTLFTFYPHRIDTSIIEYLGPDKFKFEGENGAEWHWLSD